MQKLLVDNTIKLQKFPGKGGWTYAEIPDVSQHRKTRFRWLKVSGTIDSYQITNINLAPMGGGRMFLPVNADIRKVIRKEEGDSVHIILYADIEPDTAENDFQLCLDYEPKANKFFNSLTQYEQKGLIDWINASKTTDIKIERIAKTLDQFLAGKKMLF